METGEKKNIPIRRFPEFLNDGEWIPTTLGAEMNYENGVAHENDISASGEYIVVNSKYISTEGQVEKRTNNPRCLADRCDILMVLSDLPNGKALAKCFYVDKSNKYTVNQRICKLKSKGSNSKLLFYLANRNPYFLSFDDGVKQTNLKKDDVLNCPLIIPKSTKEQEVVATCLSSLDKVLSATKSKLEQLKIHKKGLLQKLFPAKGKKLPELRFKEFGMEGEWEEKKLQEIGEIIRGITYNKADVSTSGLIVLRSSNIQNGRLVLDKDLVYVNNVNPSERLLLQNHDIVICISNGSKDLVGKNAEYISDKGRGLLKITVGAFCAIFRPKEVPYKYILQTEHYQDFVARQLGGGNINNLNTSILENYSFRISSIAEQQKIANCLTSIDEMINQYTNKVALLKLYKKGLMQQMFPTSK